MDEPSLQRALADLETLRCSGRLTPDDYAARREALYALLPGGDARRARLSARPLWWFLAVESACKVSIVGFALLVG